MLFTFTDSEREYHVSAYPARGDSFRDGKRRYAIARVKPDGSWDVSLIDEAQPSSLGLVLATAPDRIAARQRCQDWVNYLGVPIWGLPPGHGLPFRAH